MKPIATLIILFLILFCVPAKAQYIFTATDVDGATHNIQAYLDEGKPVLIVDFPDIWGYYWLLHEDGAHVDLYNTMGQGGTGEIVVLYIAGSGFDSEAEIYDIDYSTDLGAGYENVDLTEGHPIPVIVAAENPEVQANPKGSRIWMCPNAGETWLSNIMLTPEELLHVVYDQCCTSLEDEDVSLAGSQISRCDPTAFSCVITNEAAIDQDEVPVNVFVNGDFVETIIYDELLTGCTSVALEYNNDQIQEGDMVTFAVGEPNWDLSNDTLNIETHMIDTVGTTLKFEFLDALGSSIFYFNASGNGNFREVSATTNWYNYLFLAPGCYNLVISAYQNSIQTEFILVGTVDSGDQYIDTLFYGPIVGEEFVVEFVINAFGEAAEQKIWGYVFEDVNETSIFNPAFPRIGDIQVNYGSFTTFTDSDGYYEFPEWIPGAAVSISYDESVWPVYTTPNAGNVSNDAFIQNFGLNLSDPVYALAINVDMGLPYLCESSISNNLYFSNVGNQTTSGELVFTHDLLLVPEVFNPQPDAINGNVLTYLLTDIGYGSGINISIGYQEISANLLGELLSAEYILTTFDNEGNIVLTESEILTDTLLCAYDPNDKYGFPLGLGEEGTIEADTPLKYRIRFQNTGNFPAMTVVIRDTLPDALDWESFVPVSASHDYALVMNSETREVVWTFNNILLPDSASDPEGSIGTLWFDIEMNDLEIGEQIENTAYIYFDANEPIMTNTSLHTIGEPLSIESVENKTFTIYPNPAEGTIFLKGNFSDDAVLRITDLRGRLVLQTHLNRNAVDISSLDAGIYLVSMDEMDGVKLVVGQ